MRRRRVDTITSAIKPAMCSTKNFVCNQIKEMVQVCVQASSKILHISKNRFQNISRQFHENGFVRGRRGGV